MASTARFATFNRTPSQWLRAAAGSVAMMLAGLLAFHVGQDAAQVFYGASFAEAAPARTAPLPVAAASATPGITRAQQITPPPPAVIPESDAFVVKSVLPITDPIKFGEFYWDESQAGGASASGALVVTVDLTARTLSVFRDGHEIGATAILKGYGDKPTPTGVFPITQKDADHVSNLYDAPMPWMMRLTNDGVSIHGSKVEKGYATNGCIGVPDEFARRLFERASVGDKVIITDGKRIGVGDAILGDKK